MNPWLSLSLAILAGVIATSSLKASDGLRHLRAVLVMIAGYGTAFYFLSLTLRSMPLGVAYAVWSGVGTALIALIGVALYRQKLDAPALLGIGLIMAGVVVLNVFSKSTLH